MQLKIGTVVGRRYVVRHELGRGGTGIVYLVWDSLLEQTVALKLMHTKFMDMPWLKRAFWREAGLAQRINHPNVIRGLDAGWHKGHPYSIFEYDPHFVTYHRFESARRVGIGEGEASIILRALAEGLRAIHAAGLIHRDLMSDNILIHRTGERVKIFDLTFCVDLSDGSDEMRELRSRRLGTPETVAPEQVMTPERADQRADIYGFGVFAAEMLLGRHLFSSHGRLSTIDLAVLQAGRRESRARVIPLLAPKYRSLVDRCLEPSEKRYKSVDELLVALEACERTESQSRIAAAI